MAVKISTRHDRVKKPSAREYWQPRSRLGWIGESASGRGLGIMRSGPR